MDFVGASEHTLDTKNRLHLPKRVLAKFTEAERQNLMLARTLDRCLGLFTEQAWTEYVNQFKGPGTPADPEQRKSLRKLGAYACEVSVDAQGRILIPEHLKAVAKIKESVFVNGYFEMVEIWASEVWRDYSGEEPDDDSFDRGSEKLLELNQSRCTPPKQEHLGGPV